MSDQLKKHIESHSEDFELYPFDVDAGWNELQRSLDKREKRSSHRWIYSIAASIALIIAFVVSYRAVTPGSVPSEVREAQFYYEEMIDAKMVLVRDKVEDPALLQDLEELDQAFAELRDDLKEDVDNQEVVTAMIDNYRLKLKILERILEDIEDEKSDEKDINL